MKETSSEMELNDPQKERNQVLWLWKDQIYQIKLLIVTISVTATFLENYTDE